MFVATLACVKGTKQDLLGWTGLFPRERLARRGEM